MTLIAQLTDTHVGPGEAWAENRRRLSVAVQRINEETVAPDAVLLTGDLVNAGRPDEYEVLMDLLAPLKAPTLALPGNHDERTLVKQNFTTTPWIEAEHASWVTRVADITIIGLDSVKPGAPGGCVDEPRLAWLETAIREAQGPVVLAMHHPPFKTGIWWMDALGFDQLVDLEQLLARCPVDRVVCGHLHRIIHSTVAGIPAAVGIATAPHVELDFRTTAAPAVIDEPLGYQLHYWTPETGHVSHTRFIDRSGKPIYVDLDMSQD